MQQLHGFEIGTCLICRLKKALYLKQALWAWFHKWSSLLVSYGFLNSKADASLFIKHNSSSMMLVLIYVDDILVIGTNCNHTASLIASLDSSFSLKDLDRLYYFLGVEDSYSSDSLHLCQASTSKIFFANVNCKIVNILTLIWFMIRYSTKWMGFL